MLSPETQFNRLSVEDVYRMVDANVLREDDRVELIDGVLVDVSPPSAEHSAAVAWLTRQFVGSVGDRQVRVQDLMLIEGGFLMPDLMVIDPPPRGRHPSTAALVVDVAVTTHRHDARKAGRYAAAGINEYWLLDLPGRCLLAHRVPGKDVYGQVVRYEEGDRVPTSVGAPPVDLRACIGPADAV